MVHNGKLQPGTLSVVLPYYNEAQFLPDTITSLLSQSHKPDQIILVDNGSTDQSEEIIRECLKKEKHMVKIFLKEPLPGKIQALQKGCLMVRGEFVALVDADTFYPPHYFKLALNLFRESSARISAVMALDVYRKPYCWASRLRRHYLIFISSIWRKHAFTGGYGQIFRTRALLEAGGFSEKYWSYVLLDHEIMYRIFKKGRSRYHKDLWCNPSSRRKDRKRVRWNIFEQMVYYFTPHIFQDWFFYYFLANRFRKRGLNQQRLREKPW